MPAQTSASPVIAVKCNGTPLPEQFRNQLLEFTIDQRSDAADVFTLRFHDPEMSVLDSPLFALTNTLTVDVEVSPTTKGTIADGEITSVSLEHDAWGTQVVVRGLDRSHALFRNRRAKAYVNASYSDIVSTVAGLCGLTARTDASGTVHEHVYQDGLTDWEFLRGLADDIGWDLWVEGRSLLFKAPAAPSGVIPELEMGLTLLSLDATATAAGQSSQVEVRGWDVKQKRETVSTKTTGATVGATPQLGTPAAIRRSFNTGTVVGTRTPYPTVAQTQKAADAIAEQLGSSAIELSGAALGDPRIKARGGIKLSNVGKFNGTYVVNQVRHIWEPEAGYRTEFTAGGRHDRSLLGLVTPVAARDSAASKVYGVVVGIVTNHKDLENMGRVKVKFPWLSAQEESGWARVAQLLTGNGYGSLFMPEVNDEVLVAFEHGDFNRPYIVGKLYNGKDKPAKPHTAFLTSDGKIASQRLESRTHHRLVFFDDSGKQKEGVTLRTGDDKFFINLNKSETKITVSSDGDVTIEAKKGTVLIDAKDVELKTTGKLDATVQGAATLKSTAKFTVEGTAGLELKSSGPVEIKGAIVKLN